MVCEMPRKGKSIDIENIPIASKESKRKKKIDGPKVSFDGDEIFQNQIEVIVIQLCTAVHTEGKKTVKA